MTRNRRLVQDTTIGSKRKTIQIDKRTLIESALKITLFVMLCLVIIIWSAKLTDEQQTSVVSALSLQGFLATNGITNKTTVAKIMLVLFVITVYIIKFIV